MVQLPARYTNRWGISLLYIFVQEECLSRFQASSPRSKLLRVALLRCIVNTFFELDFTLSSQTIALHMEIILWNSDCKVYVMAIRAVSFFEGGYNLHADFTH